MNLVEMLLEMRKHYQTDGFDLFILSVMDGVDPEKALFQFYHDIDFKVYCSCLELIYLFK